MADVALDRLLDALECAVVALADSETSDLFEGPLWEEIVLGRCTACGYAMILDPERGRGPGYAFQGPHAWRPHGLGVLDPCPGDTRTYVDKDGKTRTMGNCTEKTFEPWKAGKR